MDFTAIPITRRRRGGLPRREISQSRDSTASAETDAESAAPKRKKRKTKRSAEDDPSSQDEDDSRNVVILRDLPATQQYFWKATAHEQWSFRPYDHNWNGLIRKLPRNEVMVMALNEIAVRRRRGFFFYLPSRDVWKKPDSEPLLPLDRRPQTPGSQYPHILYMNFSWNDEKMVAAFFRESQRGRYLKCNAIINPPAGSTPLYSIQFASFNYSLTFVTGKESLVLYATEDAYYLATTNQLDQTIGRRTQESRSVSGPDPVLRLANPHYIWSEPVTENDAEKLHAFHQFRHTELESVYNEITRSCVGYIGNIKSTITAAELRDLVPRPFAPSRGITLGTPIQANEAPGKERQALEDNSIGMNNSEDLRRSSGL